MKNKKSNDKEYQTKKQVFLSKLKDSPYKDELINQWVKTFQDDYMCNQFLTAITFNKKIWEEAKKDGLEISFFVEKLYESYHNIQGIPHSLVIPLFIGSSDEIRDQFYAQEFIKKMVVTELDGMTLYDMSN